MNKEDKTLIQDREREFALIDSIITAHHTSAIAKVNAEALQMYWEIGQFISERLRTEKWGAKVIEELSDYIKRHNPKRRGYSKRNLYNMVKFYEVYGDSGFGGLIQQLQLSEFVQSQTAQIAAQPKVQLPTAQMCISQMPGILALTSFTNHVEILNRCSRNEERVFYILYSGQQHLKQEELRRCIVTQTFESVMNKDKMLSPSLLGTYPNAEFLLKDRAVLDFLGLKDKHNEHQLHASLLEHMKQFILELGKDFIYMASEFEVNVGGKKKRIDLLFYHRALQCLAAVELKAVDYEAEFSSKMDMYLEALDRDVKRDNENPSLGIILCPSADRSEVEYSLSRTMSPTMVAEYKRVLIPREVLRHTLAEYCEFLKDTYK